MDCIVKGWLPNHSKGMAARVVGQACKRRARAQVCVEVVGYLLEELRDAKNYALFQKDVQNANIFIGSLIFIEELAEKVQNTLCGRPCLANSC